MKYHITQKDWEKGIQIGPYRFTVSKIGRIGRGETFEGAKEDLK